MEELYVISAVGKDKPGLVHSVTRVLADLQANPALGEKLKEEPAKVLAGLDAFLIASVVFFAFNKSAASLAAALLRLVIAT